jgi:hypothetical protein
MQKKRQNGRASTKRSVEDEIAHLRGFDIGGLRARGGVAATPMLQFTGAKRTRLGEIFVQPAAVNAGAAPRSKGRGPLLFSTAPRPLEP